MAIEKAHEIFSRTDELTHMTNRWYINAHDQSIIKSGDKSFCTQVKGKFLSRIVNLLIFPTDLIDTIAHVAMGILTLCVLAPGEAVYNLCKDAKTKSDRFTVIGGLRNFAYAGKHLLEAIPRAFMGIYNPEMADGFFKTKAQQDAWFPSGDEEEFLI